MRAQIKDWHQIRELEAESKFSEALAHAIQICQVCRRYQLPDGCHGCDLKTKRQQLSEVIKT
jgi:recombinational DNA repair protein RecR